MQLGPDQVKSAGIVINTVGPRAMQTMVELPGEVKADDTRVAHVVPRLQGVVTEVLKKAGDRVRRGELMAVLSSRELADAKSAVPRRVAARGIHARDARAARRHSGRRRFPRSETISRPSARSTRPSSGSSWRGRSCGCWVWPLHLCPTSRRRRQKAWRATRFGRRLDGTVVERNVTIGEAVTAEEQIFTVADLSSVWVEVSVYAKDLGAVRQGQEAVVVSTDLGTEADRPHQFCRAAGRAKRRAQPPLVSPCRIPGGQWRPGLFVTVRLVREETTVPLAVSADAIQTFRDWQVVFVKYGDWFEARPLELGRTDGQWVEVVSGLKAGDQYAAARTASPSRRRSANSARPTITKDANMLERILHFSIRQRWLVVIATTGGRRVGSLQLHAAGRSTRCRTSPTSRSRSTPRRPATRRFEAEQRVTYLVETAMAGLPRLDETRSISRYGLSQVTVIFEDGTDIYFARQLINERIQEVKSRLPPGIEPTMGPIATGLGEIFLWTVEAKPGATTPRDNRTRGWTCGRSRTGSSGRS